MSASMWDIPNWFNWYWWGLDDIEKEDPNEVSTRDEEPELKKEKPKRKTRRKKAASKSKETIQLILRPAILEELEKEAQGVDSTLNQLIQIILEAHIESKDNHSIELELLLKGIQIQGISIVPISKINLDHDNTDKIPYWVKQISIWHSERKISDVEYANGLKFYRENGIINI